MIISRRKKRSEREEDLSGRLVTILDPEGPAAEAYRTLRTNLLYALVDDPLKVVTFTSPGPGEGKSTTCANLGVVLAQANKNTLILDCDFRRPVMHRFFGLRNVWGVVDVLVGKRSLPDTMQEVLVGLNVLTCGPIPPNPAELLSSQRFAEFVARVRAEFDYVLIDAPPVGLVSDPVVISTQGDGVMLVLDAHSTGKGALRKSLHSLEAVGANIIGTVMNNVRGGKGGYYRYGYGGYTYK
ncbi:polysaccharide biosynthesis tyrosine autokinase [Rubrobacter taiwanensis]|uniref:non-specific protein-tyrosine kinase n=1 Tax=Rubrobacter taiwanensis TaxID=185139 RepID=A0A4R1BMZ2_9ACTN|nr:CpsD/CapB family tyrosine-protein kinase [Rubrobacter taiwanensis]TCJ18871.1 polysaccharide biosynthesis tyrosine autokinase [Rubrobacter taiwanensis]